MQTKGSHTYNQKETVEISWAYNLDRVFRQFNTNPVHTEGVRSEENKE